MIIGCVLVIIILVTFLFDWRTALISLTAIPLSLVAATLVLTAMGATLNTMVIAGLVIAMGEVVDDAIIDVENIVRRLRLNRARPRPRPAFRVVLDASLEVRSAVVYASLIVILVFVPVFFLEGLSGSFFRPLALAYVLAILASLLVALTVTPGAVAAAADRRLGAAAGVAAGPGLEGDVPRDPAAPGTAAGLGGRDPGRGVRGHGLRRRGLGEAFLPDFQENDFLMHWIEKPGTSLEAMRRVTVNVSKELRAVPGVRNFGSHIGRAEVADEVVGPNFTELWISIDPEGRPRRDPGQGPVGRQRLPGAVQGRADLFEGADQGGADGRRGDDGGAALRARHERAPRKAQEVYEAMEPLKGVVTDLKVEPQLLVPQLDVRLRPEASARLGLTAGDIRRAATTLVKGAKVGELYREQKIFDVFVWGTEEVRNDVAKLSALPVETPLGTHVPLSECAEIALVPAANEIKREGASRRIDVTCNIAPGATWGAWPSAVEAKVKALDFPREYHPEFLGEYAAREESRQRLMALAALSLLGILLIIHADFRSIRLTALVALTLPFALIGGVVGAIFGGGVLSLGSLVGFVTVLGIAARNGIMLVSHYRHLELEEGEPFGLDLVIRGSEERLSPILMTALATGLALVPLAWAGNKPGHEIEHPMAIVILGGLVTSTVLNLVLMPALYLAFGKAGSRAEDEEAEAAGDRVNGWAVQPAAGAHGSVPVHANPDA